MHDIWNPWHGCVKKSEGCAHCYMYYLDSIRQMDGARIFKTGNFRYPLKRKRNHAFVVHSGEMLRVCMTSDFFLAEADAWRPAAWDIIRQRPDVAFFLLTKRPERVRSCLPPDWGSGWPNVMLNVTCENQARADERIPLLFSLPAAHKGIMAAPLLGGIDLDPYLREGLLEQVIVGGENYDGCRPCDFAWVQKMFQSCRRAEVRFAFIETGTCFIKDGKTYHLAGKQLQSVMAWKSGMQVKGRPIVFGLRDPFGCPLAKEDRYHPEYIARCRTCGSQLICNGCSHCGRC
jgi:protein gp37